MVKDIGDFADDRQWLLEDPTKKFQELGWVVEGEGELIEKSVKSDNWMLYAESISMREDF